MLNQKTRILIVDDYEPIRVILKKALYELGMMSVDEAREGEEAMEILLKNYQTPNPVGIIFCDLAMPGMDGMALLANVRQHQSFKRLPFVIVSAESEQQSVLTALNAGATDYITKPFSAEVVKNKIDKIRQRLEREAS
jgi:two-component system, chemotaxis family, chemotaxis protein CheY